MAYWIEKLIICSFWDPDEKLSLVENKLLPKETLKHPLEHCSRSMFSIKLPGTFPQMKSWVYVIPSGEKWSNKGASPQLGDAKVNSNGIFRNFAHAEDTLFYGILMQHSILPALDKVSETALSALENVSYAHILT